MELDFKYSFTNQTKIPFPIGPRNVSVLQNVQIGFGVEVNTR